MGVTKVGEFEFAEHGKIGQGCFSTVYKGKNSSKPSDSVAVKLVKKTGTPGESAALAKEMKTLRKLTSLSHRNLVTILDCKEVNNHICIIMEYCNGGSLASYLRTHHKLSESVTQQFLQQLAKGMAALHAICVVYRDLKPSKVLMTYNSKLSHTPKPSDMTLKITDVGVPSLLENGTLTKTVTGSSLHTAPEVTLSQTYDHKSDLFSLGTIAVECLTGESPLKSTSSQQITSLYTSDKDLSLNLPSEVSSELRVLLVAVLRLNPRKRISSKEFYGHPYLHRASVHPESNHHGNHGASTARWVDVSDGHLPHGAVVGGKDCSGEPQYVARAKHHGATVPGKYVPSHKSIYIPWAGKEYSKSQCQVLVGGSHKWVSMHGSRVPSGAFLAGMTEDNEQLFVGRVRHKNSTIVGKVQPSHGVCYVSHNCKEHGYPDFEILVE